MRWRRMADTDLAGVTTLGNAIHLDYPEDPAVFAACYRAYPAGCHVLAGEDGEVAGYLVSHPAILGSPPLLNSPMVELPRHPDCYYLHDLALGPATRGRGLASEAVTIAVEEARAAGFDTVALIAVGDAYGFWARHGFAPDGDGLIDPAKGYGAEARAMVRAL